MSTFPQHTPEYLKARERLLRVFFTASRPHWERYITGVITHEQYQDAIEPHWKVYSDALEPHWVKAGGQPKKRRQ